MDFLERYADRIVHLAECGCMIWMGETNRHGYGRIAQGGRGRRKRKFVHREAVNAPDGLVVRHSCNVPCCVNPDHLILGSQIENMADMVKAGRSRSRIRPEHVDALRACVVAGCSTSFLADLAGVPANALNRAVRGDTFAVVGTPAPAHRNKGERHPCAKLTDDDVAFIRSNVAAGEKQSRLARAFGVTPQAVNLIIKGRNRRPDQ